MAKDEKKEAKREIDFNQTLPTVWGEEYTGLRLGKVSVDALLAVAGDKVDREEKLRCDALAQKIINQDEAIEADAYNVLALPQLVVDRIDRAIGDSAFVAGVSASAHRLLGFEEVVEFEGVEVVGEADPEDEPSNGKAIVEEEVEEGE